MILAETVKATFKDASEKLTGYRKRDFMAKVTEDYFDGSVRKAETVMGWNRRSVQLGLNERRTGLICVDNYQARGRHKSEEVVPNLYHFALYLHELMLLLSKNNYIWQITSK